MPRTPFEPEMATIMTDTSCEWNFREEEEIAIVVLDPEEEVLLPDDRNTESLFQVSYLFNGNLTEQGSIVFLTNL